MINLETTQFVFAEIVDYLQYYTVITVNGKQRSVKNFCVVLVGDTEWDEFVLGDKQDYPVAFRCPKDWTMAQVLYKLGAFKSIDAAIANGFGKPIEKGFSEHLVKIKNEKGALTLFKE